ncbi:MAG: hypothetical protein LUD18_12100, partial [Lachnospiraceae bacterium]|nr:hypothetical protein [Lachnospiraceae bacterium]
TLYTLSICSPMFVCYSVAESVFSTIAYAMHAIILKELLVNYHLLSYTYQIINYKFACFVLFSNSMGRF